MYKYDEMVVRITIFCREPLNFGLFYLVVDDNAAAAVVDHNAAGKITQVCEMIK